MALKLVPIWSSLDTAINNAWVLVDEHQQTKLELWIRTRYTDNEAYNKYLENLFHETFVEYKINICYKHTKDDIELWAEFDNSEDEVAFILRFL